MKKKVFIGLGVALAFFVLFGWRLYPHTQQDVIERVFRNRQIFDVVMSSQQVTVQSLHKNGEEPQEILAGYTNDAPVLLSAEQAQKIKNLLTAPSSYLWNVGNSCMPDYGVLFNFQTGGHTVRVALCFKCRMVGVFDGEDNKAGQVNYEYLFDPMRKQLAAICIAIFPNDKEIQALQ